MKINYKGFIRKKIQKNPVTISPDTTLFQAWGYLHVKGVRHLPVVDKDDRLIGIVTDRDLREASPSDATSLSVHELIDLLALGES